MESKYIVCVNYGCEGWNPIGFETVEELEKWVVAGRDTYGEERVFTKRIDVSVKVDVEATIKEVK